MQTFFMQTMKTLIRLRGAQADLSLRWAHMSGGSFLLLRFLRCPYDNSFWD